MNAEAGTGLSLSFSGRHSVSQCGVPGSRVGPLSAGRARSRQPEYEKSPHGERTRESSHYSVLVEVTLNRLQVSSLGQRKPEEHARLLRVEAQRSDEAILVIVDLDIPADLASGHA